MRSRTKHIILTGAIIVSVTLSTISVLINKDMNSKQVSKINSRSEFLVKIVDNEVILLENDAVIKKYDINFSLLPGEDQLKLTKGIKVYSISEADLLAEDYDG